MIQEWEEQIKERELAEKRSLAPGWLDREEKLLEPERITDSKKSGQEDHSTSRMRHVFEDSSTLNRGQGIGANEPSKEGEELDRVFGGLSVR